MLTRSAADQGHGKLVYDGARDTSTSLTLPKLPGASSSLSAGGGSEDGGVPGSARTKHLRGGSGNAARHPS